MLALNQPHTNDKSVTMLVLHAQSHAVVRVVADFGKRR